MSNDINKDTITKKVESQKDLAALSNNLKHRKKQNVLLARNYLFCIYQYKINPLPTNQQIRSISHRTAAAAKFKNGTYFLDSSCTIYTYNLQGNH